MQFRFEIELQTTFLSLQTNNVFSINYVPTNTTAPEEHEFLMLTLLRVKIHDIWPNSQHPKKAIDNLRIKKQDTPSLLFNID